MLVSLLLLACGSPGLTETPVPDDTSVGTDDSGKDTNNPDDTGATGEGSAPEIMVFKAEEEEGLLRFGFQVKDADDDLDGGSVKIKVPPREEIYEWAGPDMSISNGTVSVYWDVATIQSDVDLDALLTVTDAAGNASAVSAASFRHDTKVYYLGESGDARGDAHGLGMISLPAEVHGDLYSVSNNGSDFTGDVDWFKFAVPVAGSTKFTLTWDNTADDYDVYLFVGSSTSEEGWSAFYGDTQPETFTMDLPAGQDFFIKVAGWQGSGGDYTLTITR